MVEKLPRWIAAMNDEELLFLKRFLLNSGSLKGLAAEYGVTYPTVRARLDRLIEKVASTDLPEGEDAFERLLELLVNQGVIVQGTARTLQHAHKRVVSEATERAERETFAQRIFDER
ncbi:MAG: DUF2089 family protein [Candidatus Hydrogenedentes bacterium]|nr:DUF2089 family protein [Candidatus Hydrogenedentota bacterium]